MNIEQETMNQSDSSFHLKGVLFMCTPCNRRFCIVAPENGQGTCPRCDQVSTTIINDEKHEIKPSERNESQNVEPSTPSLLRNLFQEQETAESQSESHNSENRPRLFRIVRRIIFRAGGVIVIETVVPVGQEMPQSPAFPGENTAEEGEDQSQAQQNPFASLLEFLLMGQMMGEPESTSLDRIIEEFLRNDPNKHGPAPATEENINSLNEFDFEKEKCKFTQCSVCQEDYNQGEKCLGLPCEHDYHKDCITEWLKLHDSCPICRKPIAASKDKTRESMTEEQPNPEQVQSQN